MLNVKLDDSQANTLINALRVARDRFIEDAKVMRDQAAALRAGQPGGLFADGEPGARAADRLAAQFDRQVKETEALIDLVEGVEDDGEDDNRRCA